MTIPQALELALQHHRAGRLAEAEALYRDILAAEPSHANALHLLGVIAHQGGRHDHAVELISRAITLNPDYHGAYSNLGEAYRALGRFPEAIAAYRQTLRLKPDQPEIERNLGVALTATGQLDEAVIAFRRALRLKPDHETHYHLGLVLAQQRKFTEAIASHREAIKLWPDYCEALNGLGIALAAEGDKVEAIAAYRRALALRPDLPVIYTNLGGTLTDAGRLDEALAVLEQALACDPHDAVTWFHLGVAHGAKEQLDEAVAAYRRALELKPDYPEACNNLGGALKARGKFDEAIDAFRRAIALTPEDPQFHWNAALALLALGRFREGWEEFEWRLQRPHLARPDLTTPRWNGEDLSGKTLLIHQEGGFGDVIQFIRYLPMIRARGAARILFEGGAPLLPLMKIQPGIAETVARGQPLPVHHFHCSPQSFPRLFGTELSNIPAAVPYLAVDQEKQSAWRRKLSGPPYQEGEQRRLLVGLCWAGSAQPSEARSRTLRTFGPLAPVPNVTFVSLQKGPEASQSAHVPSGMKFVDAAAEAEDFSDLAALVSCLDAVASVDTSVAHLAGALGISTWILIPQQPDFRWLTEREASPWYPTVRLFRQQDSASWEEPVQRMANEIKLRRNHLESEH